MNIERVLCGVVPRRAFLGLQLGLAVWLLKAEAQSGEPQAVVPLEVHADGSVLLGGRFIRYYHRLDVNLAALAAQQPKPVIEISTTQNVSDEVMAKVTAALARAGLASRPAPR